MPIAHMDPKPLAPTTHFMDDIPTAYLELDLEGKITFVNRAACELQNLPPSELIGRTPWQFMPTREVADSMANFVRIIMQGAAIEPIRHSSYTASGEFRIHDLSCSLKKDVDGSVTGLRVLMFDVTDSHQAHQDADQSHTWLESVLFSMTEAIIVIDALGLIRLVNPAAEQLSGWTASELCGSSIEVRLPVLSSTSLSPGSICPLDFRSALEGPCKGTATVLNHAGDPMHVEISASPILDAHQQCTTGIVSLWRRIADPPSDAPH